MSSYLLLRPFSHRLLGRPVRRVSSTRPAVSSLRRVRPSLEALEERITPTLYQPLASTADGAVNSLRADITLADQDSGPDTIQLQAGTYTLTQLNTAGHDSANKSGDLNILTGNPLLIEGATHVLTGTPTTIIQQTVLDRVFDIFSFFGSTPSVTFKNLIIEGGKAVDDGEQGVAPGSKEAEGGGILDLGGNVKLSNVVLMSNKANTSKVKTNLGANGGGIYVKGGSLTIQGSVIQDNQALGGGGAASGTNQSGGFAEGGGVFATGQTSITNSTLSDNIVTAGSTSGGSTSITANGGSALGGGIFAEGPTTITNSILSGNKLTGGNGSNQGGEAAGGSVYFQSPGATAITMSITTSTLSSNTLTGGKATDGPGGPALGGGVLLEGTPGSPTNTTLTATACSLTGNTLTGGDGNFNGGIASNLGGTASGGGVYASGGQTTVTISTSTLSGNTLTGGNGSLSNDTSSDNGDLGGAVSGGGVYATGPTIINSSLLAGNTLTGGTGTSNNGQVTGSIGGPAAGGGVYTLGTAKIADSTLSGNTVTGGSGPVVFGGPAAFGTAQGGGAFLGGTGNTLVNTTIANNQVIGSQGNPAASGGGLFIASTATATLTNVTVADNTASLPKNSTGTTTGGGIENTNTTAQAVVLTNSLVALNSAALGPDFNGNVQSDHDLIGNDANSSGFDASHGDKLGDVVKPLDPQLGLLTDNGGTLIGSPNGGGSTGNRQSLAVNRIGPTGGTPSAQAVLPTMALLPGSPAIDAGDNSAQSITGPSDQRGQGFTRVANGTIDIGAFELQQSPSSPSLPSGSGGSSSHSTPPPTLHTPPLLAFFDALLGGVETVNGNGTETVTDSIFGIPLIVATYDSNGNLLGVTIFGINVTFFFE